MSYLERIKQNSRTKSKQEWYVIEKEGEEKKERRERERERERERCVCVCVCDV